MNFLRGNDRRSARCEQWGGSRNEGARNRCWHWGRLGAGLCGPSGNKWGGNNSPVEAWKLNRLELFFESGERFVREGVVKNCTK